MRVAFLLCAAVLLSACPRDKEAQAQHDARDAEAARLRAIKGSDLVPFPDSPELIARIEDKIEMPAGAGPLSDYTRRYSRSNPNGSTDQSGYVYGLLERTNDGPRDARWVEGILQAPMDGGCSVVTLRYSIAAGQIDRIACNGDA